MAYNLKNISEAVNPAEYISSLNNSLDGMIGLAIMIVVFFAVLILANTTRQRDITSSLIISSFSTTIVSFLLLAVNLIEFSMAQIPLALLIISLIIQAFLKD